MPVAMNIIIPMVSSMNNIDMMTSHEVSGLCHDSRVKGLRLNDAGS